MSSISTSIDISSPRFGRAWRNEYGGIHAAVRLTDRGVNALYFESAEDARTLAAACEEAAKALDELAKEADQ